MSLNIKSLVFIVCGSPILSYSALANDEVDFSTAPIIVMGGKKESINDLNLKSSDHKAVFSHGYQTVLEISNGSISHQNKNTAYTVHADSMSTIKLNDVSVTSSTTSALRADDGSSLNMMKGVVNYSGNNDAIYISKESEITLSHVTVNTGNNSGYAVNLNGSNSSLLMNDVDISHEGKGRAIWIADRGASASITNGRIETTSLGAYAIDNQQGGRLIADGLFIKTRGDGAFGITSAAGSESKLHGVSIVTEGDAASAVRAQKGKTEINGGVIQTFGNDSHGIYMDLGGESHLYGVTVISKGLNSSALKLSKLSNLNDDSFSMKESTLYSQSSPTIHLNDVYGKFSLSKSTVIGDADALMINNSNIGKEIRIQSSATEIIGNITSKNPGSYLSLNSISKLHGTVKNLDGMSIDKTSRWEVTGDSYINKDVENNGVISFEESKVGTELRIGGDLTSDGIFHIRTELADLKGDSIVVDGNVVGRNKILVRDSGIEPSKGNQSLILVSSNGDGDGKGDFSLLNKNNSVNVGAYKYELKKNNDGDAFSWGLVNTGRVSDQSEVVIDNANINTSRMIWVEQMNNLHKRLGDLKYAAGQSGLWTRGYGAKLEISDAQHAKIKQRISGFAIGYDVTWSFEQDVLFSGIRFDVANANQNYEQYGSGSVRSYDIAAYLSYLSEDGYYSDFLISTSKRKHVLNFINSDGGIASSNYQEQALGGSFEIGKEIKIKNGFFIEPQAELSIYSLPNSKYIASNGLVVNLSRAENISSRFGAALGSDYTSQAGDGRVAFKFGMNANLLSKRNVVINGHDFKSLDTGTSYYVGVQGTHKLDRYGMIYFDASSEFGSIINRPWSYSIGYRFIW